MVFSFNVSTRGIYIDISLLQHSVLEQKIIPEDLPSPTDKYKLKYRQYEEDLKEEYKQYSERIAEKKRGHQQCPETSIKVAGKIKIAFLSSKFEWVIHYSVQSDLNVHVKSDLNVRVNNFFHVFIVKTFPCMVSTFNVEQDIK